MSRFKIRKIPKRQQWRVYDNQKVHSTHRSRSAAEDKIVILERSVRTKRADTENLNPSEIMKILNKYFGRGRFTTGAILKDQKNNKLQKLLETSELRSIAFNYLKREMSELNLLDTQESYEYAVLTIIAMNLNEEKNKGTRLKDLITSLGEAQKNELENNPDSFIKQIINSRKEPIKKHLDALINKLLSSEKTGSERASHSELMNLREGFKNLLSDSAENITEKEVMYAAALAWINSIIAIRGMASQEETGVKNLNISAKEKKSIIKKTIKEISDIISEYKRALKGSSISDDIINEFRTKLMD